MIVRSIISFLLNRNWQIAREDERAVELIPPANFELPGEYRLIVPTTTDRVDFDKYYANLLQIFSDFYQLNKEDLDLILGKEDTILKVRIYDGETNNGKIGFLRFEGIIERLKAILTDTVSFVIDKNVTSTRVPQEAYKYLNKCHFLQTEKGSFITNIQLPNKELVKDRELFDREEIYGSQINDKLSEVLTFINNEVFTNNTANVDDDYLIENEGKLNLKLLKDIETFYDKSDLTNIDFSFHSILESKTIENQNITKEKIYRLTQFIDNIRDIAIETKEVVVKGVITTLKSKDPEGLRNTITMTGIYNDLPVVVNANLNSENYKDAIEAHKIKEYVEITGLAKTTKTRIRFIRIDNFSVG